MSVPVVPWAEVAGRIQRRVICPPDFNPHIVAFSQTGGGKDHMFRWGVLPVVPLERVVVLVNKRGGDRTWYKYGNLMSGPDDLPRGFGRGPDGTPRYVVPISPDKADRTGTQRFLNRLGAEGGMLLVASDLVRLTTRQRDGGLDLERDVSNMMTEGRENNLVFVAAANSVSWAASGIKDQAGAVLIGRSGGAMCKEFANIAGLPTHKADDPHGTRRALETLQAHWWFYSDHADGVLRACISTPPPAGWCSEEWPPPDHLPWPPVA